MVSRFSPGLFIISVWCDTDYNVNSKITSFERTVEFKNLYYKDRRITKERIFVITKYFKFAPYLKMISLLIPNWCKLLETYASKNKRIKAFGNRQLNFQNTGHEQHIRVGHPSELPSGLPLKMNTLTNFSIENFRPKS